MKLEPGQGVQRFIRDVKTPQITRVEEAEALARRYAQAYPRIAEFWKTTAQGSLLDRPVRRLR